MGIAIIGHRGASGFYPENTMLSFQKAFEMGCDGIELDIQTTADRKTILFHDWTLERTSNGEGLVRERDFDYLRALDVGSWFDPGRDDCKNLRMPTLEEVLEIVPQGKLVNIEIKELFSGSRVDRERLIDLVKRYKDIDIVISSFNHNLLSDLYKIDNDIRIGLLLAGTLCDLPAYTKQLDFKIYSYHPYVSLLSEVEIRWMQSAGIKVFPWTVGKPYELEVCKRLQVDGIITNYPSILTEKDYTSNQST